MKKDMLRLLLVLINMLIPFYGMSTGPTEYNSMMAFLNQIDRSSCQVTMEIFGKSVSGRDLAVLYFSHGPFAGNRDKKPLVLIFCQQHGDEPSGKEAALLLAKALLSRNSKILDHLDILLIPSINPDGSEMRQRRNANNRDLNRNHLLLSEPETLALHQLFQQWFPEITLDVHEYNAIDSWWIKQGMIKNADEMLGWLSNLNIDPTIRSFSRDIFYPSMKKLLERDGFIFSPYIVGTPDENDRLRYSTNDIDDGRQSLGIYNTLSFILEGKRYGDVDNMLERRTSAQLSAMMAFLQTSAERSLEILTMVRSARARLLEKINGNDRVFVRMDYFPDPYQPTISFPVFNLNEWKSEWQDWSRFEPVVKVKKSLRLPIAYVVPSREEELIDLLERHHIIMQRITDPVSITVEKYRMFYISSRIEEERSMPEFDLEKYNDKTSLQQGDIIIFLNQKARNLIPLILEPESSWGILTETGGHPSRFSLLNISC